MTNAKTLSSKAFAASAITLVSWAARLISEIVEDADAGVVEPRGVNYATRTLAALSAEGYDPAILLGIAHIFSAPSGASSRASSALSRVRINATAQINAKVPAPGGRWAPGPHFVTA